MTTGLTLTLDAMNSLVTLCVSLKASMHMIMCTAMVNLLEICISTLP